MKTKIRDYLSQIWPEIIGLICTFILSTLTKSNLSLFWVLIILLSPWIIVFPLHNWIRKKKRQVTQDMVNGTNTCAISCLNEMRRISHKYPQNNADPNTLNKAMTEICEQVFHTLAQFDDRHRTIGYDKYCVFVSLLDIHNNNELLIHPLYRNHSEWSDRIYKNMPKNKPLKDNSPYEEIYKSYKELGVPKIVMTSNIKEKLQEGKYKSSYAIEVGTNYLPYNSSCILPILPFHNERKGDEIQGYLSVVSERSDAFSENDYHKEVEAYFETVSGYLYKICIKTQK